MIAGMMQAKAQVDMDRAAAIAEYRNGPRTSEAKAATRMKLQEIKNRSIMTPESRHSRRLSQAGGNRVPPTATGGRNPDDDALLNKVY